MATRLNFVNYFKCFLTYRRLKSWNNYMRKFVFIQIMFCLIRIWFLNLKVSNISKKLVICTQFRDVLNIIKQTWVTQIYNNKCFEKWFGLLHKNNFHNMQTSLLYLKKKTYSNVCSSLTSVLNSKNPSQWLSEA